MRSAILAVLALAASVVSAQGTNGLPLCAGQCVGTSFGGCGSLDVKCICSNQDLIAKLACCVSTGCNPDEQAQVIKFADSLCSGQGVTNLPKSATCAPGLSPSTTASATSSTSASGAGVTTTPSAHNGTTSATGSTPATSASRTSVAAGSANSSAPGSTSTATPGSGSNRLEAALYGVGALFFGALAAL